MRHGQRGGHKLLVAVAALCLLPLAACGGTEINPEDEIATLQTVAEDGSTEALEMVDGDGTEDGATEGDDEEAEGEDGETDAGDAALEFSECMRNEKVDNFPDLPLDVNGNIDVAAVMGKVNVNDEKVRDAFDVCKPIIASGGFGGSLSEQLESPEFQQALLDFSDCVRGEDIDAADLSLSQLISGAGAQQLESGGSSTGFGDRTSLYARALGVDGDDPEVSAAIKKCQHHIDTATSAVGL